MKAGFPVTVIRGVAQLVAHLVWDQGVAGSNPVTPTKNLSRTFLGDFFIIISFERTTAECPTVDYAQYGMVRVTAWSCLGCHPDRACLQATKDLITVHT